MTEHAAEQTADHSPDRASHRKDYFRIFWVLTILTIAEVAVAKMKMDHKIVALYWHFVDLIWILVFTFVSLI